MNLLLNIEKQTLTRLDTEKVVANSQEYLYTQFTFSDDWENAGKYAIFYNDKKPKDVYEVEIIDNKCLVPFECLTTYGGLFITIKGSKSVDGVLNKQLITTNPIRISIADSGKAFGILPEEAKPSIIMSAYHDFKIESVFNKYITVSMIDCGGNKKSISFNLADGKVGINQGSSVDWNVGESNTYPGRYFITGMKTDNCIVDGVLTIPSIVDGKEIYGVVTLFNKFHAVSIDKVIVSDGIKSIGKYAFCINAFGIPDCPVKEFLLPESVEEIDVYAFCLQKTTEKLNLPHNLKRINDFAFESFAIEHNLNSFKLEDTNLNTLGAWATECAYGNQSTAPITGDITLKLPETIEYILAGNFNHSTFFNNVELFIPKSLKQLCGNSVEDANLYPSHAFYDFAPLTFKRFRVSNFSKNFSTDNLGALYTKDKKTLIAIPAMIETVNNTFTIADGCTCLGELCFGRTYDRIKKIKLPDSYTIELINPTMNPNVLNTGNTLGIAIYNYTRCEEIIVNNTNTKYATDDGNLYTKDYKTCWYIPFSSDRNTTIKNGCIKLESGCLGADDVSANLYRLSGLFIPASVTDIAVDVLNNLNKFKTKVTIDSANTSYGKNSSGVIIEL